MCGNGGLLNITPTPAKVQSRIVYLFLGTIIVEGLDAWGTIHVTIQAYSEIPKQHGRGRVEAML